MMARIPINLDKWFHIITDKEVIKLEELDNLIIDEISKTTPNGSVQSTTIESVDGEIPEFVTYGSYDLELNTLFRGIDKRDVDAFIFKINNMLSKRKPYYIRHSDLPGIKYAVKPTPKIEASRVTIKDYEIKITFECYKGYSESYKTVQDMNLLAGDWQIEGGARFDDDIKYTHNTKTFDIYNGSYDTIDPLLNHYLYVKIKADAENGLTIKNNSTGDKIEWFEPLTKDDTLEIKGVYPMLNGNHAGRYTDMEFLTLKEGYNSISIYGDKYDEPYSYWDFNFLYR